MTPRSAIVGAVLTAAALGAAIATMVTSAGPGPTPDGGWQVGATVSAVDGGALQVAGLVAQTGGFVAWTPGAGYVEFDADGGARGFSCICASDAGPCLLPDGGQLGSGTYPAETAIGLGCLPRPCVEFSGVSGAPRGCVP